MPTTFADRPNFWRVLGAAALVGSFAALGCIVFLAAEHLLTELVWGDRGTPTDLFSGSWTVVAALIVAALLAGWIRRRLTLPGPDPNFVAEMVEGDVAWKQGLGYSALGLTSLIGGASIGPEAPLGTLGGAIGTSVSKRVRRGDPTNRDHEVTEDLTFAGISAVFGGLTTFPFAGPIVATEVYHPRWQNAPARMLPGIVSATAAVAVLYPLIGSPFLEVYDLGDADLKAWWILLALSLGLLGAVLGLGVTAAMGTARRAGQRIGNPIVRVVASAVVIGAVGFVLPLTLFSGREELDVVLTDPAALSTGLLALVLAGKVITLVLSMQWGFFGGPVFPLVFLGAVAGVIVNQLIPGVPLVVAIPSLAAAVTVTLVPLPLTVMFLTTMMFGLGLEQSIVPAVATVTAFILVRSTDLLTRLQPGDAPDTDVDHSERGPEG